MSKIKKIKNALSSLDINKLYELKKYVSVSQDFFNKFEAYIFDLYDLDNDSKYIDFSDHVIELYYSLKNDLNLK